MSTQAPIVEPVLDWYAAHARGLPWRAPGTSPWGVLVSEFMCQQTQVDRVVPKWLAWLDRWPSPRDLAADSPADAIRMWDRLGYPRRAKWLHASAVQIATIHDNEVPSGTDDLLALPGVGEYTAAAVQAFAFGQPSVVLDTNVRRVLARAITGTAAPGASPTRAERALAGTLVAHPRGAEWSQSVMELGALVCTARAPHCEDCPVRTMCAWRIAGAPPAATRPPRQARFEGSDRQVRGQIMAVVRDCNTSASTADIAAAWPHALQRDRALQSLLKDGLLERTRSGRYRLARG